MGDFMQSAGERVHSTKLWPKDVTSNEDLLRVNLQQQHFPGALQLPSHLVSLSKPCGATNPQPQYTGAPGTPSHSCSRATMHHHKPPRGGLLHAGWLKFFAINSKGKGFQTATQKRCSIPLIIFVALPLDLLQQVHVFLVLRVPGLDAVLQDLQVLPCRAALNPFMPQPILILGIAPTQAQDLGLGLVELHEVYKAPLLQPVKVPLDGIPSLKCINFTTQLGVISKLADGALNATVSVINKIIEQYSSQCGLLKDTTYQLKVEEKLKEDMRAFPNKVFQASLLRKFEKENYQQWLRIQLEEIHDFWRKASVAPIFRKGGNGHPGNYRPVSCTLVPGKIMEQVILEDTSGHMKKKKMIRNSQHGFTKVLMPSRPSCLLQ
ncbi:hypothetical protein QYF61_010355 [Mycteria americana]|uniref:Uncharacterized protein n=1 Tax=Mycteria americana TaxID=33587 RepID=A0AAN7SFY1_MYCAM|nr:hypothetical protein QYF61_010355 [Mycteria americana]